jgi:hypothetical protein
MEQSKRHSRNWIVGSLAAITVTAAMVLVATSSGAPANAASRVVTQARPHATAQQRTTTASYPPQGQPVTAFSQQFASNTNYFCPAETGNAPCDGNGLAGDYGTIDRVSTGFSNGGYGNYAPSTPALTGNWMAVVSGDQDGNQGTGCPGTTATSNPGEVCSGPYALFGTGSEIPGGDNVYPSNGFTVTDDLYLSPTTAPVAGSLVDDDVEINNTSGGYGSDNIITACAEAGGSGTGFVVNFGNGSPGSCSGTPVITTDGWYRFVFDFSNVAGNAYVSEFVLRDNGGSSVSGVASSGPLPVGGTGTATAISNWGGPGYFWLPTEDMSGLPLANFALQLGNHANGHNA